MKKFNVFLTCFACLFLIAWIYLDMFVKLQSAYWVYGKLIVFGLIFGGSIFIRISRKQESTSSIIFGVCFAILWLSYFGYKDITKYNRIVCQDKYGPEFNNRRRGLGIPEIPEGWHIAYRGSYSVDWNAKKGTIGHEHKVVYINRNSCEIDFEMDDYHLKLIDTMERGVRISSVYAKGRGKDSVSFAFDEGHNSRAITRKQADSIFNAEKIQKDY